MAIPNDMSLFEAEPSPAKPTRVSISDTDLDAVLTAQFVVAWAGEGLESKRLGWWRSEFVSEFGGHTLFRQLLPKTWEWAALQAARESARRKDAELRLQDHAPDAIVSLFGLGPEIDERIEERLQDLKRSGVEPHLALPELGEGIRGIWSHAGFAEWVTTHGPVEFSATPLGRRLKGDCPESVDRTVRALVAALNPLPDTYPLPHFRRVK